MTEIMKFNDSVIMTIPGIGYINGGMILGEIGDIHRFSNPSSPFAAATANAAALSRNRLQASWETLPTNRPCKTRWLPLSDSSRLFSLSETFKCSFPFTISVSPKRNAPPQPTIPATFSKESNSLSTSFSRLKAFPTNRAAARPAIRTEKSSDTFRHYAFGIGAFNLKIRRELRPAPCRNQERHHRALR